MLVLEHGRNVIALEFGSRLTQGGVETSRTDAAFELRMRENVFKTNEALWHQQDQPLEETPQRPTVAAHQRSKACCRSAAISCGIFPSMR